MPAQCNETSSLQRLVLLSTPLQHRTLQLLQASEVKMQLDAGEINDLHCWGCCSALYRPPKFVYLSALLVQPQGSRTSYLWTSCKAAWCSSSSQGGRKHLHQGDIPQGSTMSAAPVKIRHEFTSRSDGEMRHPLTLDAFNLASRAFFLSMAALALSRTAFAPAAVTGLTGRASVGAADDAACPLLVSKRDLLAEGWSGPLSPAMAPQLCFTACAGETSHHDFLRISEGH